MDLLGLEIYAVSITAAFTVAIFELFQLFGLAITASSVVELERQFIQVTGFILAFTGVTYASVFSQIRLRESRSKYLYVRLGVRAIGAFIYLFVALVASSWTLVLSLNLDPKAQYSLPLSSLLWS